MRTAVVGGGAAGFFLAINLKEMLPQMEVTILERSQRVLAKVGVSGGGRCNCTNSFAGVSDLSQVYPRGHRLLKRLFKQFDYRDAYQWFERHGVRLTTQADNCVFPASQDSQTIINCFLSEARRHQIEIGTGVRVENLDTLMSDYDFVAVCTGGSPRLEGLRWLADAGHEIAAPVPSLFTLSIDDAVLRSLMGTVVENVTIGIPGTKLRADGPLLVTHWGVSGPAVLRLSSYAARHLSEAAYQVPLAVNWTGCREPEVLEELLSLMSRQPQKQLQTVRPFGLPARPEPLAEPEREGAEPPDEHPCQRPVYYQRTGCLPRRVRHLWRRRPHQREPLDAREPSCAPSLFRWRGARHRWRHRWFQLPGCLDNGLHRCPSHRRQHEVSKFPAQTFGCFIEFM